MGFFDCKWIVTFEYSNSFFSNETGSIAVEASSEYSAKDIAKRVLKASYKYVEILNVAKADNHAKSFAHPASTPIIQQRPSYTLAQSSAKELTREEQEELRLRQIRIKEAQKRERKEESIELLEKLIKEAPGFPLRCCIVSGVLSFIAFLFSWLPFFDKRSNANSSKFLANWYIEKGYSSESPTVKEYLDKVEKYTNEANLLLLVPFAVLVLGIAVTILVFVLLKKRNPQRIEKLREELRRTQQ